MKKLATLLAFLPALAFAAPPSLEGVVTIHALTLAATTTTWSNSTRTAILTSDSGTENDPSTAGVGLDLTGISAVQVILKTSSNASTGTLQAYLYNVETATWARAAAYDLTATATTHQTWTMVNIPVGRGRLYYAPNGIGSVQTTIYIVGQTVR